MKKRIISIFIALMFVFQTVSVFSEDTTTQFVSLDNSAYELSQGLLEALGVNVGEVITDYTTTLTRGQAAKLIADLLNLNYENNKIKHVFHDVNESSQYIREIEVLASYGVIHGYENRTYRPDDNITFEEAVNLFLKITGHYVIAEGEEYSYARMLNIGNRIDLYDNVRSHQGDVIAGDFIVMAYNALHADIMEKSLSFKELYYTQSDTSLLYEIYQTVYSEGVITKNDITTLWSSTDLREGEIYLSSDDGDVIIDVTNNKEARHDIGTDVRVYYCYDRDSDKNEYVFHHILYSNEIIKFDFEELDLYNCSYINRKIAYVSDTSSKTKTENLASDCTFIYNNMYYAEGSFDFTSLDGKSGYITLIDNNGDGRYDVLKVNDYNTFLIADIGVDENEGVVLYDKLDNTNIVSLNEDDYIYISIKDEDGKDLSIESIMPYTIVSVMKSSKSAMEKCIEVLVSEKTVSGNVSEIDDNGFYKEIKLDRMDSYKVLKKCDEQFKLGNEITAYLDAFGKIAYVDITPNRDMNYGIMLAYGSDGGLGADFLAKIITLDGSIAIYHFADKFKIDNTVYKQGDHSKAETALDAVDDLAFDTSEVVGAKVIRYRLNEENLIEQLDTTNIGPKEDENNSISLAGSGTKPCINARMFGYTIPYKSDAKTIQICTSEYAKADDIEDELLISATTAKSAFKTNKSYIIAAFKTGENETNSDFIVHISKPLSITDYDNTFFVLTGTGKGISEKSDDVLTYVEGYNLGVEKKFFIAEEYLAEFLKADYKNGDVIRFVTNGKDEISEVATIVKLDEYGQFSDISYMTKYPPKETATATVTIMSGGVYQKDDDILVVSKDATCSDLSNLYTTYIPSSTKITIVENGRKGLTARAGALTDIKAFEHHGPSCSKILMRYRSSALKEIVVWNLGEY